MQVKTDVKAGAPSEMVVTKDADCQSTNLMR